MKTRQQDETMNVVMTTDIRANPPLFPTTKPNPNQPPPPAHASPGAPGPFQGLSSGFDFGLGGFGRFAEWFGEDAGLGRTGLGRWVERFGALGRVVWSFQTAVLKFFRAGGCPPNRPVSCLVTSQSNSRPADRKRRKSMSNDPDNESLKTISMSCYTRKRPRLKGCGSKQGPEQVGPEWALTVLSGPDCNSALRNHAKPYKPGIIPYPKAQNSPNALHNLAFGPKKLEI